MTLKINFSTPVFTGNLNNECKRVETTAIIGTMRWWYEAIVRGFGGFACDPTNRKNSCRSNANKKLTSENVHKYLCPACQLFGGTGWRRQFDLIIQKRDTQPERPIIAPTNSIMFPDGRIGSIEISIIPNTHADSDLVDHLYALLSLISQYAGLGAKQHRGYGLFALESYCSSNILSFLKGIKKQVCTFQQNENLTPSGSQLPTTTEMVFREYDLSRTWTASDYESFLDAMRYEYEEEKGVYEGYIDFLFGNAGEYPKGQKIKSWVYSEGKKLRLFGWIPDFFSGSGGISNIQRDESIDMLNQFLGNYLDDIGKPGKPSNWLKDCILKD